jgi:hypothetical protein
MTQNQIAYKNATELERHNRATEAEQNRHQVVAEALQKWANALQNYQIAVNNAHYVRMDAETSRANKARESETFRSDVAGEYIREHANRISAANVAETARHQRVMETLQDELNKSTQELNYARSSEAEATAGLRGAQTVTEGYRPGQIVNEIDLTNSSANLNRERLGTEKTIQIVNSTQAVRNVTQATGDVFKVIGDLIAPAAGGAANATSQARNIWAQFDRLLRNR